MESSSKIIQLSKELEPLTLKNERTYLLYGSDEAIDLYEVSLNHLLLSDNYDFDVVCIKQGKLQIDFLDTTVPFENFLIIDENTHRELHINLCGKLKKFIVDPMNESHNKRLKIKRGV